MPGKIDLKFPKSFLWGVSTSAHQVEGGNHNQWTVWELENARSLATSAPYHFDDLDVWEKVKRSAKSPNNYVSGKAAGHYDLYEADFDLAKSMGLNVWRFSIEWSRIQPTPEAWDASAIGHYREYIAQLKKRGLEPIVTLFHFTLPVWFTEMGGFEKRSNVRYFVDFADRLVNELGSHIRIVITINEPDVYVLNSYKHGLWPPAVSDTRLAWKVLNNLAHAHNQVAKLLHAKAGKYKVSVAKNSAFYYPGDDAKLSVRSSMTMQYLSDDLFLRKVIKNCDFIGVNYYLSNRVYGYRVHNPEYATSDIGWAMEPQNLEFVLERLNDKYHTPLLVTENGLAAASDKYRTWWIRQSILALHRSIRRGIPVFGYLHWSLLDNFEWEKGFWPKFGLFEVDRRSQERRARPSAKFYAKVVKSIRKIN